MTPAKRKLAFRLLLLCTAVICRPVQAADRADLPAQGSTQGIKLDRLALVGGGGAVFRYLGYRYVDRAWYQGKKQDHIRWINDWSGETYLNIDKGGHFMGGLYLAQTLNNAYAWSNFSPRSAALLGTLTSWAALLEIEMRDAHFDQWGFSIPDFVANTVGASIPLMYALFPRTQAIRFKWSYFPSALYRDNQKRAAANQPHFDYVIDDYEGMTFWMTLSMNQVLRGRAEEIWPDYLGLALGYGAVGMHGSSVKSTGPNRAYRDLPDARSEIFLALDCDARLLPGQGRFWRYVKDQLNWIHLPAPAVRLHPEWRFYLLYM